MLGPFLESFLILFCGLKEKRHREMGDILRLVGWMLKLLLELLLFQEEKATHARALTELVEEGLDLL